MNLTLSYIKERLLLAGRNLQHAIVNMDPEKPGYNFVHDAQNQLALGLAALVQIEHDGVITAATPSPITLEHLANWLKGEAIRRDPHREHVNKYTEGEKIKLLQAAAVLESLHPSLLDS